MNSAISDLPVRMAIDLLLRDVGYSNPMPEWFAPLSLDSSARKTAVENTMDRYLNGSTPPKPFEVAVPRRRTGKVAKWLQLSLNDQMVLQACVSALAPAIDKDFDRKRVFSYRYNTDQNSSRFIENQCDAARSFQDETASRGGSGKQIMWIDLQEAFASVDRSRFLGFLSSFSHTGVEIKLLKTLLDASLPSPKGIPLINSAFTFLANAYFTVVDTIIEKHTKNFYRFVDDYWVVADSRADLESLYKQINRDLQQGTEFQVNEEKLYIFAAEEYCERLSDTAKDIAEKSSSRSSLNTYTPVPQNVDPNAMAESLSSTINDPDKYLNDGVGRLQLEAMRRLRQSLAPSAREKFSKDLTGSPHVVEATIKLLDKYAPSKEEMWRSVWVLYMMKDINVKALPDKARDGVQNTLQAIKTSRTTPEVVKLWARWSPPAVDQRLFEKLADADYEEAGRRCCGG